MNEPVEIHVEQLIGKRVRDLDGCIVGRIEELATEIVDGRLCVTEFHLGPSAAIERLGGVALELPFLRRLAAARWTFRIDSRLMDLSTPDRPRVLRRKRDLARMAAD